MINRRLQHAHRRGTLYIPFQLQLSNYVDFLDHEVIEFDVTHYRSWAFVDASNNSSRPSNYVMHFLEDYGYDIIPINPNANEVLEKNASHL